MRICGALGLRWDGTNLVLQELVRYYAKDNVRLQRHTALLPHSIPALAPERVSHCRLHLGRLASIKG
jgi:hypothetical protein